MDHGQRGFAVVWEGKWRGMYRGMDAVPHRSRRAYEHINAVSPIEIGNRYCGEGGGARREDRMEESAGVVFAHKPGMRVAKAADTVHPLIREGGERFASVRDD